jgi:uncharacterized protein (UPF0335 family)
MSDIGHNSDGEKLRLFIERIENLNTEIAEIQEDRKDVFLELKAAGYEPKIIRQILRDRKVDRADRDEQRMLYEDYAMSLGML